METNPIIKIRCTSTDWSNLGATCEPTEERDTITMRIHLGVNNIEGCVDIEVLEITDDKIVLLGGDHMYRYELHKGERPQSITHTVSGYTDHDGCDWDGTDYHYWLSWE